jgi:hypothetical protein
MRSNFIFLRSGVHQRPDLIGITCLSAPTSPCKRWAAAFKHLRVLGLRSLLLRSIAPAAATSASSAASRRRARGISTSCVTRKIPPVQDESMAVPFPGIGMSFSASCLLAERVPILAARWSMHIIEALKWQCTREAFNLNRLCLACSLKIVQKIYFACLSPPYEIVRDTPRPPAEREGGKHVCAFQPPAASDIVA